MRPEQALLINNKWVTSASERSLTVVNPAYGTEIAQIAVASISEIDASVQAAAAALRAWSRTSGRDRAAILHRAADIFRSRYLESTATILTQENGKPLNDSLKECRYTADVIDFYADEARRITGTHFTGDLGQTHSFMLKQPVGVVAAILPFNFPVDLLAWKIGPGLAAGCTFVIKPSELAPLSVMEFVQAFVEAGLPEGALNLVTGDGAVGAALVDHPLVNKVAFTGSLTTGIRIGEAAARGMKRTTLELGGSAPFIVGEDADLDLAVSASIRRCFSHSGQICISVNRIFVHQAQFQPFVDRFVNAARQLRVAPDGLKEPSADMGPLVNQAGLTKVERHVEDALHRGARVLTGGVRIRAAEYSADGFFYPPTVLIDVNHDMQVMSEETFGPVAPIMPFKDIREAVYFANITPYALAAYVYTHDLDAAFYCAREIRCGGVGINVNDITDIRGSFGGMGLSGIGRELGTAGMDAYFELKHVRVGYTDADAGKW